MSSFVRGDAGRDVVRLCHVRLHQRRPSPQSAPTLIYTVTAANPSDRDLRVDHRCRWGCWLLGPFVAFFAPAISAVRRGDGRDLPDVDPAHGAGITYNNRQDRQRRGSLAVAAWHRGAVFHVALLLTLGRVPAGAATLGPSSGNRAGGSWTADSMPITRITRSCCRS